MIDAFITVGSVAILWLLVQFVRTHRPSLFTAKVSGALFDLGLQVMKFEPELNKIYLKDCITYFATQGKNAHPYEMAARFYIKAVRSVMKGNFEKVIGKTNTAVVVATNDQHHNTQVFLVFSDDSSFEIYGSSFSGGSGLDRGGVAEACSYAKKCGGHVIVYPPHAPTGLCHEP